jgi:hypothetical protein
VKTLPTVIASSSRNVGIEVVAYERAERIENRDAVGFYHDVRLQPAGELSRLAVLFSGTVMAVKPELFGLPTLGDREATFRTYAETAIGDYLDREGLPDFTPSGVSAAKIDCFSPHFQGWRDRPRANDETVEQYLFAHAFWSWKYEHTSWTLGPSDLLRLNQTLGAVARIVRLHEGQAWTVSTQTSNGITLVPTASFLRDRNSKALQTPVLEPHVEPEREPVPPDLSPPEFVYVDEARIADLRRLDPKPFDLRKLIAFCEELNQSYRAQCYHAVAALTRALIDHVPPIFGFRTFGEVVNHASGTQSFKDTMRRLDGAARKIADSHLHTPVRDSEVLPTRVQVNFSNEVDVLLGEIIRILQP